MLRWLKTVVVSDVEKAPCGKTPVLPHNRRPMSDSVEEAQGKWQLMDVDVDVVVVGAGPTGLMLAGELGQAGMRTLLLERRPEPSEMAKAGGLAGRILQLLHYRGELDRFREASIGPARPEPAPRFPFGGLHLDFTQLEDSPMRGMLLPQPRLEGVLAERAIKRGAALRRGHLVVGLRQHDDAVTVQVRGPDVTVPGGRAVPGGLRRWPQPGPRPGRYPVPGHFLP